MKLIQNFRRYIGRLQASRAERLDRRTLRDIGLDPMRLSYRTAKAAQSGQCHCRDPWCLAS
ncbi:hypothetical protein [Marinobacterium aestuariivivens]|uniref:DUF1127 domain-containing protein n=1 Tax=Marinobacterium aestuariivivens TaxID=1698799 RepID=A0ABW2A3L8_9GAMM